MPNACILIPASDPEERLPENLICGMLTYIARRRAKLQDSWKSPEMSHLLKEVEQNDLVHYGLIPEFVGRFPVICSLQVCTRYSSS